MLGIFLGPSGPGYTVTHAVGDIKGWCRSLWGKNQLWLKMVGSIRYPCPFFNKLGDCHCSFWRERLINEQFYLSWVPAENKLRLWAHFERAGRMWVWMARSWREGEFVWMQQECSPGVAFVRAYLSAKPPKQLGLKGFQRLRFVWVSSWRLPQCSMGESGPGQRSPPLPLLPLGNAHCVHQKLDIWSGFSDMASFWLCGYVNGRFWLLCSLIFLENVPDGKSVSSI